MNSNRYNDPSRFEILASYKSGRNTELARGIHGILSFCSYDRQQAHRWALRLMKAQPKNGEDVAAALVNFDYMVDGALAQYQTSPEFKKMNDRVFQAYSAWLTREAKAA